MMRLLWTVCIFLFVMPVTAQAQAIVKSGEHEDFSRLVIYLPREQVWSLDKSKEGYSLDVEGWSKGFDTSEVFDQIPRERVSALSASARTLVLTLGCDCIATAEPLTSGGLYIDVRAAPVTAVTTPIKEPDKYLTNTIAEAVAVLERKKTESSEFHNLDRFRSSLLEGLGRSASLSLVEIDPQSIATLSDDRLNASGITDRLSRTEAENRLRISNGADQLDLLPSVLSEINARSTCPAVNDFDIAAWGEETDFGRQIAALRSELFGEFDRPKKDQLLALARLYLYFGLGSEAQAVTNQFPIPSISGRSIAVIADILDEKAQRRSSWLQGLGHCDDTIVPWSVLDRHASARISDDEAKVIVSEFSTWPSHLKIQLGPPLIAALNGGNQETSAAVLRSILARPGAPLPAALTLVDAETRDAEIWSGQDLLSVVDSGRPEAAEALDLYLRQAMQNGKIVDRSRVELAVAYASELRGAPIGEALTATYISALFYSGELAEGLTELERANNYGFEAPVSFFEDIVRYVMGENDPASVVMLSNYLVNRDWNSQPPPINAEVVARRLLELGLPRLAKGVIKSIGAQDISSMLKAEIAIGSGDVLAGHAILQRILEDDANVRRAELSMTKGDVDAAWAELGSSLPDDARGRLAWAATQWSDVTNEGPKGDIAKEIVQPLRRMSEERLLADAQELKQKSIRSREAIEQLLAINP